MVKGVRGFNLGDMLPQSLYLRLMKRIGLSENDNVQVQEVLRRLCNSGDTEMAITVLDYITSLGESRSLFTSIPMSMKPTECDVIGRGNTVFFIVKLNADNIEDEICVAIDEPNNITKTCIRACTRSEYNFISHEKTSGETMKTVALEL